MTDTPELIKRQRDLLFDALKALIDNSRRDEPFSETMTRFEEACSVIALVERSKLHERSRG